MKVMKPSASIQEPTVRIYVSFIFGFQSIVFGPNKCNKYRCHLQGDRVHLQVLTYYRVWQRVSEDNIFAFLVMQFWVVQTKQLELISTKKRLTKPLIAVERVAENK